MKKFFKSLLYWFLMLLIMFGFNTPTIVFLAYWNTETTEPLYSKWNGEILAEIPSNEFKVMELAEQTTLIVFMIIGAILTLLFIKWLWKDTIDQARRKRERKEDREYRDFKRSLE